jgi:nicotinate-nucleotide pyrophosphorylase (carboxylating)
MKTWRLEQLIELGLEEDLGNGDVTTAAVVDPEAPGVGRIVSREPLVVSGVAIAAEVFRRVDPELRVSILKPDGSAVMPGATLMRLEGRYASILTGERLALNFLGRLSGVATNTRRFVDAIAGLKARIVDTRKTTPGFRALEKAAVRHGGGHNHRFNLSDGVLIKDNHLVAAGGVRAAVERARKNAAHHLVRIEVEVDTLEQLREALDCGVEVVLLDNMSLEQLREAVRMTGGRALLEASGGVRLDTVRGIAETGVDLISAGSLVHGARWVDVALDLEPVASRG